MKAIPLSSISALASNNPYTGSDYYLLIGIDTNYPVTDLTRARIPHTCTGSTCI